MRREFAALLEEWMKKDERIILVTADLGYGMWDRIRARFNGVRFHCLGSSEFAGLATVCGLASCGHIAIFYSITPFALYRPAEIIRLYMDHEGIPAKIIGAGRDNDYGDQSFTHCMPEDKQFLSLFPNVVGFWPESVSDLPEATFEWLFNDKPSYLNLRR